MLSLFSPRSIRHFLNCRRKQTKTEILFSYLIIFEVNNRFVAFSIDKNFQKSTEIGSQFHNLPPACSSVSPASSLSFSLRPPLPACSPSVSFSPRLPSPAAPCRRLSTAAFSASAYISAAASDPPRPILRFPRPPAGCPSPLLLPAGLYHPAVSSNLPQPASSLSFSLRPPLPACSPAVSLPPCPHASAVSVRCPSTASSFSRSALPPPLNRCFLHSGGLFDALSLCPISFLQSKKTCRKHVFSFRHFFTACIPVPQQKHLACNRIHPARFRGFSAPTKPASGSICGCRKT